LKESSRNLRWRDISFNVAHIRFTIKPQYHPPYLWIERYRPRRNDWQIMAQLTVNNELKEALKNLLNAMEGF